MARTQNMKKLMPSILAMAMGAILGNSAMASETTALQAAPAYTATQTKGETLWSNDDTAIGILGSVRLMAKTDSNHTQEHNIQKKENEPSIPATGMAVLRQQYVLVEAIQAWIASLKEN